MWWVYVLQSEKPRFGKRGRLPGVHYVGCTTNPTRRIRQHGGELVGGGRYTAQHRPWVPRALFGPYPDQSTAMKAERALKRGKRGKQRPLWSPTDSKWCRGLGPRHPWVTDPGSVVKVVCPECGDEGPHWWNQCILESGPETALGCGKCCHRWL